MAKIAWADNVANVRRGAAYIPVAVQVDSVVSETGEPMGATSMSYEYYVTELREVTYADDTSRLYLILIDPRDGTVLAERYYELDTSAWGLFYMDNGEMLLYTASIREGVLTLSYYTLNWQIMTKMTADEPVTEISLYESHLHTNSMTASIDNAISMYKLQVSWQDFVTSLVEYNPTAVLVADGVFGPSTFFSYEDITGEGWLRLLLVMDGMVRDDLVS